MEIYSPRKNYNFSSVKNELKGKKEKYREEDKVPYIKPGSVEGSNDRPTEVMRRKLFDRLKLFFDYQDVVT